MHKLLFAFDLDGTLLQTNGQINPETIKALDEAKAKGHILSIATGRAIASALPFLDQWSGFDYLVCNNGTAIYKVKEKEVILNNVLPNEYVQMMIKEAKDSKSFFTLSTDKDVYPYREKNTDYSWMSEQEFMDYDEQGFRTEEEILKALEQGEKVTQLALRNSEDKIKELGAKYKEIFKDKFEAFVTNRVYLDINPLGSDKYNGVKIILDQEKLTNDNLVTFGDSGNDIIMLEKAKFGNAMSNGTDMAKKVASKTIGNHNSDTIAKRIRELI